LSVCFVVFGRFGKPDVKNTIFELKLEFFRRRMNFSAD